ncbi:hypothetical protein LEP3755_16820 [Leptolyngbya sp. NIES-3755]|nr:hypothetical protein LEP3755_16820 [Leptolyngbya sp. NIES-3755]
MSLKLFTPEEYLDLEAGAKFRSDYDAGIITPKSGGTLDHNRICGNFLCLLSLALKAQNYEIFAIDIKVWIPTFQKFRYPNLMVIAGEPKFYKNYKTAIDHFYKTQPKHWQVDQFDDQDVEIQLRSVDVKLAIADIYDRVQFDQAN